MISSCYIITLYVIFHFSVHLFDCFSLFFCQLLFVITKGLIESIEISFVLFYVATEAATNGTKFLEDN